MAFSICMLFYGDHAPLAGRLLDSFLASKPPGDLIQDVRIGVNHCGVGTMGKIRDFCSRRCGFPCIVFRPPQNVGKYPLMRRMFYDNGLEDPSHVMWFDDDSFFGRAVKPRWWSQAMASAQKATMVGRIHTLPQRRQQFEGVQAQPWFNNKKIDKKHVYRYVTGAWWTADFQFLKKWDYPFYDLYHNGGDSMLGELIRQQKGTLTHWAQAQCHCESCSKKRRGIDPNVVHVNMGGRKGRRGIGVDREVYVWQNWKPGHEPDLSRHNFTCRIDKYGDT